MPATHRSTQTKELLNRWLLNPVGLKLESLTKDRQRTEHVDRLQREGAFDRPAFPVLPAFEAYDPSDMLRDVAQFSDHLDALGEGNSVGYSYHNEHYPSPDAEVLYTIVSTRRPAMFLEVGSGNSTKIVRQAIRDHDLPTQIWSVDPQPRTEIDALTDRVHRAPVQDLDPAVFDDLGEGDVLFIDSSHRLSLGGDLPFLYLHVLPRLRPGVLVHIHDILLPYEYPPDWHRGGWEWDENYLVQAILAFSDAFEVLWPGHYVERTTDLSAVFPDSRRRRAQSLWLKKVR